MATAKHYRDDELRLPPGEWVLKGNVQVYVEPPKPTPTCICGCLLTHKTEPCPACLVWAIDDAIRQSWRPVLRCAA